MWLWRVINPPVRLLAGIAPWWVSLETTGRRSGRAIRTPLAKGPVDGHITWLIAVHGARTTWVRNIEADPSVRLKLSGRWRDGRASAMPYDPSVVTRFNRYARMGPKTMGIDPCLVRVELDPAHVKLGT